MSSTRSSQYVEVQLEIGHKATPKTKSSPEGHTHDWTVFVRGPENSNIQHFVEKVVFHLHESFPKPKRVVKDPPYQVSESGYASFELPVEVYFKNKEEPKKICFDYDLYLRLDDAVSHSRREKLTFQNPSNDFKKKLLKAGGVTNESNGSATKVGISEDKPQTQPSTQPSTQSSTQSSATNPSKPNKSNVAESKRTKTSGVIPSKDKSLSISQNTCSNPPSNPPSIPSVPEKHSFSSNNKQFTDLFGPPIQAKSSTETKIKDFSSKSKYGAIPSKGVKTDSKTSHKNSTKKSLSSSSSPLHKQPDIKSSKELKDSKIETKNKENTKNRREDAIDSKTKKKSQIQSQQSPKISYDLDKKQDIKASKKRRNSTSSNSSSLTTSSFGGTAETKSHKESQKSGQIGSKEKDNKKENKKQKVSTKDINSASGVKKQSSTSTKISFSDNNSSTTIEIKSVKKEKTWDNEVKKSRNKEFKSNEYKGSKDKSNPNNAGSSLSANKTKPKSEALNSPKVDSNKNLKVPKEKHNSRPTRPRKRSTSVESDSTPLLSSPPSNLAPNYPINPDIESHESLSPLSSDNTSSSLRFKPIRNNKEHNNGLSPSDDSDSDQSVDRLVKNKDIVKKRPHFRDTSNDKQSDYSTPQTNKRKRDQSKDSNKRLDSSQNLFSQTSNPNFNDSFVINDLIDVQKKINESTNSDLLQKIVDIIEESGLFSLTKTTFDFDLMKLDEKTIRRVKSCLS